MPSLAKKTPPEHQRQSTTENQTTDAATTALLRSLQFSGVKFLRYMTVDACNNLRVKVKPIDYLVARQSNLRNEISIAAVCYAGLPYYADSIVAGTGMTAEDVLQVQPDLHSFRILPYALKTAVVMGTLHDQYTGKPSPLDTRALLQSVVDQAAHVHNLSFSVGVELEFCLVDVFATTTTTTGSTITNDLFVDQSVFGNTTTLNDHEAFLSDLYDQLQQQYIPVELIHSESGPGQVEVVLEYSNQPVAMADHVVLAQETIRAVAKVHDLKALFLPKYRTDKAGNGMHLHLSVNDDTTGAPLFGGVSGGGSDVRNRSLSSTAASMMEGILRHLPALMGLSVPTVNSFRRIGPDCWTGSQVGWAVEDKESALRIVCCCSDSTSKNSSRGVNYARDGVTTSWDHVEYKLCDPTCNLYLALAGIFAASLEGITNEWTLRPSLNERDEGNNTNFQSSVAASNMGGSDNTGVVNTPLIAVPVTAPLPELLPDTLPEALEALEHDKLLIKLMGDRLSQGYLALRYDEAERSASMSLEEQVQEALARA